MKLKIKLQWPIKIKNVQWPIKIKNLQWPNTTKYKNIGPNDAIT